MDAREADWRAAIKLAAEHIQETPPTDYDPQFTLHDVFAGFVLQLLDEIDERRPRLEQLAAAEL